VTRNKVPDVLTIDQLADYLQITKSTLYKLVQAGRVPGKKVGRQWRFHRDAVDSWLARGPDLSEKPHAGRGQPAEGQEKP
jgi:excisionase family DNA binding protein